MTSANSAQDILSLLNDIATNVVGSSPIKKQSIPEIQQNFKRANAYLTPFLKKPYLNDEEVPKIFQQLKWTYDDESTDLIKSLILRLKKLEIAFKDKKLEILQKRIPDPVHPQNNGSTTTTTCSLMMVAFFLLLL